MKLHAPLPPEKATRVYIAGPMRGYPKFNFEMFDLAKRQLERIGLTPVSPADLDRAAGFTEMDWGSIDFDINRAAEIGFSLNDAIRRDVEVILTCDEIVLLPGYESSVGARAEIALAQWAGKPVSTLNDRLKA